MAVGHRTKASKVARKRGRTKVAKSAKKAGAKKVPGVEEQTLVLEGTLGIKEVAGLKQRLAVILEADGPITIDAARVENADTAVLQVLTAFVVTARSQSRSPMWKQASEAFQELAGLLDLRQHLGLETAILANKSTLATTNCIPPSKRP